MNKEKVDMIEDLNNMYQYLFPSDNLLNQMIEFNFTVGQKMRKLILSTLLLTVIVTGLSFLLPENEQYIFVTIIMLIMILVIGVGFFKIFKVKCQIFKSQTTILNKRKEDNELRLLLHANYKKYNLKWNIIFSVIIVICLYVMLSLFIGDLIINQETSFGPMFAFVLLGLILLTPTIIINYWDFKRFRTKQRLIERKIDEISN